MLPAEAAQMAFSLAYNLMSQENGMLQVLLGLALARELEATVQTCYPQDVCAPFIMSVQVFQGPLDRRRSM